MKTITMKMIFVAFLTICISLTTSNVYANKVKKLIVTPPQGFEKAPVIKVKSVDGEKWSVIDNTHLIAVSTRLRAECRFESRGNKNYASEFTVPGFEAVGKTKPENIYIPHAKQASGVFQYINNAQEPVDYAKVCNDKLADKVASTPKQKLDPKYRKYAFLSEGFSVNYPNALTARYKLYCHPTAGGKGDIETRTVKVNAVVDCQASVLAKEKIPVEIKKASFIPLVSKVEFTAQSEKIQGVCKAGVDFDGYITSARSGEVKYRYVSKEGKKSPIFTMNFTKAERKETNNWHDTVSEPDQSKSLEIGGNSNKVKPNISGWWKLELVSPQSNKTATAKYAVYCNIPTVPLVKPKMKIKRGS